MGNSDGYHESRAPVFLALKYSTSLNEMYALLLPAITDENVGFINIFSESQVQTASHVTDLICSAASRNRYTSCQT